MVSSDFGSSVKFIAKNEGLENRWFSHIKKNENAYKCSFYIENLKENNDNIMKELIEQKAIKLVIWIGHFIATLLLVPVE